MGIFRPRWGLPPGPTRYTEKQKKSTPGGPESRS